MSDQSYTNTTSSTTATAYTTDHAYINISGTTSLGSAHSIDISDFNGIIKAEPLPKEEDELERVLDIALGNEEENEDK